MPGARAAWIGLACLLVIGLGAVLGLRAMGEDLSDFVSEIALPLGVLGAGLGAVCLLPAVSAARRVRNRRTRAMVRYQLVLSQADEATFEQTAAAMEQLVQSVRRSLAERCFNGQPWLALESWYVPPARDGETGTAVLIVVCEPDSLPSALAALRRAYPDLSLRTRPGSSEPLELTAPRFVPGHVLRVRKARNWALPLGTGAGQGGTGSDARSTMAGVIRQQQQARRLSCVRWCILPAADQLDSRAADKLRGGRGERHDAARSGDIQAAMQAAGGAMCYLELQACVEARQITTRRGRTQQEGFNALQNACRQLLSPALSHRGANHLSERMMMVRQRLYRRRWVRAEPPLVPQLGAPTLMSPRELALLMELPSLGSEHTLPLQRNTIPNLPLPTAVMRTRAQAKERRLPPPDPQTAPDPGGQTDDGQPEVLEGEIVLDAEPAA